MQNGGKLLQQHSQAAHAQHVSKKVDPNFLCRLFWRGFQRFNVSDYGPEIGQESQTYQMSCCKTLSAALGDINSTFIKATIRWICGIHMSKVACTIEITLR